MNAATNARTARALLAVSVALCLAGCVVGPDFKEPAPPATDRYTSEALSVQQFLSGQDIPAQWWSVFHSDALDALIREVLNHNPDLQSAQAAVRVAMEELQAQRGDYRPQVSAGVSALRAQDPVQISPLLDSNKLVYSLYSAQAGLSWTLDVWGGNRRRIEAGEALARAQHYQLQAVQTSLIAGTVLAAIEEGSLRQQIVVTEALLAQQQALLEIARQQRQLGQIAGADIALLEAQLAQTRQLLPPLRQQLSAQRNLLTALAGRLPADSVAQIFNAESFTLPNSLPISLPSQLVAQRADVRVAMENLHAASAQIGAAYADRLPGITLSAGLGTTATGIGQLFDLTNGFWNLGAELVQPVFNGGALKHRYAAARATYDQAAAQYQSTVIASFADVANALQAVRSASDAADAADEAVTAATTSARIAEDQLRIGHSARSDLLLAQQALLQTRLTQVQMQAARLASAAALFQALGGGWSQEHRQ